MRISWKTPLTLVLAALGACATVGPPAVGPGAGGAGTYEVYVANESSDLVQRVAFTPGEGVRVVEEVETGVRPADLESPHGMIVSPDGRFWYVTIAHGTPFGTVWKYRAGEAAPVATAQLGRFPASLAITPDGERLFVVNFNLHGDPVASDVSVVDTRVMQEIARIPTCVMPHGSRINEAGTKQYSVCMHSNQVVEIDTESLEVIHRFDVTPGHEAALPLSDLGAGEHAGMPEHVMTGGDAVAVCSPTWVTPGKGSYANEYIYVACNKNAEVLEIRAQGDWKVTRRFPTGKAPYNLAITPNGELLLASLKGEQGVAIIDLEAGREAARVQTTQPITHGVDISPDSRYAFVTNEAVGSTPGTLDVIDLERRERVASAELAYQPGGIAFWRVER